MRLHVPAARYDQRARVRFFQNVEASVAALPGVRAAGVIGFLPISGSTARLTFTVDGAPAASTGSGPGRRLQYV